MYFQKIGEGNVVLFLHGWGCDGSIFLPIAKMLVNNCCYLVDFAGFGKSDNPPLEGWSVQDYAVDVVNFLKSHSLKKVTIVAHSFGCRVALMLSASYPAYVSKMILVAPAGLRKFSFKRFCKVAKYKITKFLCRMGLCQNLSTRYGSVDYNACDDAIKNTFVKVINQDLSKYAKVVRCPTLIVNGKEDMETPLKHAKQLQKLIVGSSLVEIEGGHFAFFTNPQAFARTIQLFEVGV